MKGNIFIKRPVMAISISILILAIGLISLFTLPVEQYPDIAPPTVHVSATYTGADANAVMNSVIMPLEESINDVHDFNSNQCRFGNDRGIFQTRDKPRYGSRQRTESCNEGTGFIAC